MVSEKFQKDQENCLRRLETSQCGHFNSFGVSFIIKIPCNNLLVFRHSNQAAVIFVASIAVLHTGVDDGANRNINVIGT